MTETEVDRLERYLDKQFTTLETRVERIESKMDNLERDMATLRVFGRLAAGITTGIAVIGIVAGLTYLAK